MIRSYQTRHLVARIDMRHDGQDVRAGDTFLSTPLDADYLVQGGHAVDVPAPPPPASDETVAIMTRRPGRGRTPSAPPAAAPAPAADVPREAAELPAAGAPSLTDGADAAGQ